jgi:hypothetical protein
MALFGTGCPVDERERTWIHDSMAWLRAQFGDAPLTAPVILPTSDWFPPPYSGSEADVRAVVSRVAGYMGARPDVRVRFSDEHDHMAGLRDVYGGPARSFALGQYSQAGDARAIITIERSNVRDPAQLLATVAHELGHARLLGEERITGDRPDGEPLTDLATVYLGMGIFTANAAFEFIARRGPGYYARIGGWSSSRSGYLTEQMFGYGLACRAVQRAEQQPPWTRYLDTNPRVYMKQGLRYLRGNAAARAALGAA